MSNVVGVRELTLAPPDTPAQGPPSSDVLNELREERIADGTSIKPLFADAPAVDVSALLG